MPWRRRPPLAFCFPVLFFLLAANAPAKVFNKSFFSDEAISKVTAPVGSHTFGIPNPLPLVRIDWYVNGAKKESDLTGILATPAKYTQQFKQTLDNSNAYFIAAKIYKRNPSGSAWTFDRNINWALRAGKPDLKIISMSFFPGSKIIVRSNDSFGIAASVSNLGGEKATAGLLADQTFAVFLDGGTAPISTIQYDDVSSFEGGPLLDFSSLSIEEIGAHTLTLRADATDAIDEYDETNNDAQLQIYVIGDDWLQVPYVAGERKNEAKSILSAAGFTNVVVETEFHPTIEAGRVISQTPPQGSWVPPHETITIFVSLGPECTLKLKKPRKHEILEIGSVVTIKWHHEGPCCNAVSVDLYQGHAFIRTIKAATPNDGKLRWKIAPSKYAPGDNYLIRIYCDDQQDDYGATFTIALP